MIRAICLMLAGPGLATPLPAGNTLTGPEFAALTTGRTIAYATPEGDAAGVEHYLPGKRVLWHANGEDSCQSGSWFQRSFPDGPAICFAYDERISPACWYVTQTPKGITVRHASMQDHILVETPAAAKMPCTSPFLGS